MAFAAPFKFYRDEPRSLTVEAQFRADGDTIVADCRLLGSRLLPNQEEPQVTVHFTGRVRLAEEALKPAAVEAPPVSDEGVAASDIYQVYFHGPAYQVIDLAWAQGGAAVGRMAQDLPANHQPEDVPLVMRPRLTLDVRYLSE